MRPENTRMKRFLEQYGVHCMPKYIYEGSMRGTWRLYNLHEQWTEQLQDMLTSLSFTDFQGKPLGQFSGNGGMFSVFVRGHDALLQGK